MKSTPFLASMIALLILTSNCGTKSDKENQQSQDNPLEVVQKPDSVEKPKTSSSGDTTVYQYANYDIKVFAGSDIGDIFRIVNRKKGSTYIINQPAAYFVAVVDQYLVVDSGTGPNNRGLDVYDLDENKVVLSGVHEDLKIEGRIVRFNSQIEIADESKRPKCREDQIYVNGYVEEQTFDLTSLQLVKTGKIECAYFQ